MLHVACSAATVSPPLFFFRSVDVVSLDGKLQTVVKQQTMEGDTICNAANLLRRAVVETVGDPAEPRPGETSSTSE